MSCLQPCRPAGDRWGQCGRRSSPRQGLLCRSCDFQPALGSPTCPGVPSHHRTDRSSGRPGSCRDVCFPGVIEDFESGQSQADRQLASLGTNVMQGVQSGCPDPTLISWTGFQGPSCSEPSSAACSHPLWAAGGEESVFLRHKPSILWLQQPPFRCISPAFPFRIGRHCPVRKGGAQVRLWGVAATPGPASAASSGTCRNADSPTMFSGLESAFRQATR